MYFWLHDWQPAESKSITLSTLLHIMFPWWMINVETYIWTYIFLELFPEIWWLGGHVIYLSSFLGDVRIVYRVFRGHYNREGDIYLFWQEPLPCLPWFSVYLNEPSWQLMRWDIFYLISEVSFPQICVWREIYGERTRSVVRLAAGAFLKWNTMTQYSFQIALPHSLSFSASRHINEMFKWNSLSHFSFPFYLSLQSSYWKN